jgi:hypothetical protein
MNAARIASELNQAKTRERRRVQAGADPAVAGWQRFLEGMLIRLEDYLRPGSLVTFQSLAPDEKVFFEKLSKAVAIPPNVSAVFIPPSVRQGMMFNPDSGPAPARIPNDSGILLAIRQRDYAIVLNTFFALPPYAAGIDVYEEGRLLAGYSYATVTECRDNLGHVMRTYLNSRAPVSG